MENHVGMFVFCGAQNDSGLSIVFPCHKQRAIPTRLKKVRATHAPAHVERGSAYASFQAGLLALALPFARPRLVFRLAFLTTPSKPTKHGPRFFVFFPQEGRFSNFSCQAGLRGGALPTPAASRVGQRARHGARRVADRMGRSFDRSKHRWGNGGSPGQFDANLMPMELFL